MAEVRLEGVSRVFAGGAVGVRDVDLTAEDGELLVLVGPSGSGKSTLLRIVAGLEAPTAGRVWIGGDDVTDVPPQRRNVAMVFQSYALYPHKSVRQNLAFGLRARGVAPSTIDARVAEVADALGIAGLLERRPAQLSGGQRQRVALGRAMVREPHAFLLDEPLSNLDPALRVGTRAELARLQRRLRATVLYVTHDQEEAMTLGRRVAVVNEGRVQQVAPPMTLYREPANLFVASFVGSPPMNLIHGVVGEGGSFRAEVAGEAVGTLAGGLLVQGAFAPGRAGDAIVLGARPHDIVCERADDGASGAGATREGTEGTVELVEPLGSETILHVKVEDANLIVVVPPERAPERGERVVLRFPPDRLHWFEPESGKRIGSRG